MFKNSLTLLKYHSYLCKVKQNITKGKEDVVSKSPKCIKLLYYYQCISNDIWFIIKLHLLLRFFYKKIFLIKKCKILVNRLLIFIIYIESNNIQILKNLSLIFVIMPYFGYTYWVFFCIIRAVKKSIHVLIKSIKLKK